MTSKSDRFTDHSNERIVYSDFTKNLDVHPDTGDLFIMTNENSIKMALSNLVKTNYYERFYNPQLAGNIIGSVFENSIDERFVGLKKSLQSLIVNNEPRVNLLSINITKDSSNTQLNIIITYTIANFPNIQVLSIFVGIMNQITG
jgi:phage baseplate assembly protein W